MVYTKAGFIICLVHRHLDCLVLLAPDEYPDGFGTPPLLSLISLAHPYLESSPRELKTPVPGGSLSFFPNLDKKDQLASRS